jgi:hypothetical protein
MIRFHQRENVLYQSHLHQLYFTVSKKSDNEPKMHWDGGIPGENSGITTVDPVPGHISS